GSSLIPVEPCVRIPKGFWLKAQGCEERATLGPQRAKVPTPTGLWPTTAIFATTPLGLRSLRFGFPRVARSSQPWAGGLNPFGIGQVSPALARLVPPKTAKNLLRLLPTARVSLNSTAVGTGPPGRTLVDL